MPDDSVSALYRRYGAVLYSRCRRLLADDALARDAVQECFVRLYPYLVKRRDPAELEMLTLRISTNICLDWLRRRSREELTDAIPDRPGPALDEWVSERDWLLRLVRQTPEKLREAALLHYVDGLSQEKIARVLQVSPRTVFSRLQAFQAHALRARKREERFA